MPESSPPPGHQDAAGSGNAVASETDGKWGTGPALQRRRTIRNALLGLVAVCALLGVSYLIPIPSVSNVRSWGEHLGSAFVWVFFVAYVVVTLFPVPRTLFTVMSGVFFGPLVGLIGAMTAATAAASIAFVVSRRVGRERVSRHLRKPLMRTVDYRLAVRGWLAVGSLRLIPVCPFWLLNYCSGLSAVRFRPYLVATVICMAPGTAAVVLLGDAMTGTSNPALLLLSATFFAVGVVGLIVDTRVPVRGPHTPGPTPTTGSTPATQTSFSTSQVPEIDRGESSPGD